jgi:mycofactocin precursor
MLKVEVSMGPSIDTQPDTELAEPASDAERNDEVDDLLVEEISIDGMCGVY